LSTGAFWNVSGNAITAGGIAVGQQYLGTSNAQDVVLATSATERLRISSAGNITLPSATPPTGSRLSISGSYGTLTADATQIDLNATYNAPASAFNVRGISQTTTLTGNSNGLVPVGIYSRLNIPASNGTIAEASGVWADFFGVGGGGSVDVTRYVGFRSRFITNKSKHNGVGLYVEGPNNTGVLPTGSSFTGIQLDTIPAPAIGTRRYVFFYNGPVGNEVLISANGSLVLGTTAPAATSRLEVSGTAGTPNVRMSSIGGIAKIAIPPGYDRIVVASTNGDLDNVSTATLLGSSAWILGGNTGITGSNNIIGITDVNANPLRLFTNNVERVQIASDGRVGIGVAPMASYQLAVSGNQRFTGATTASITANQELVLEQTGDTYGASKLRIQHRDGSNGALFETVAGSLDLMDIGFKPGAGVQSNIRLEFRPGQLRNGANSANGEFQYLMASTTSPLYVFSIGRSSAAFENVNLGVGDATPDDRFTVGSTSQFRVGPTGDLVRINDVPYLWPATNATGVLQNNGSGTLSWAPVSVANGGTGLNTTPTNGQLLIGNGTGYTLATITAGTGISITNAAGAVTIASTGSVTVARNGTTDATNNAVTYQDATEMSAAVSVNTTYTVDCLMATQNSSGNGNTDIQFTFPSGTMTYSVERADATGDESVLLDSGSPAGRASLDTDGSQRVYRLQGVLYVGPTGGTLRLQFKRTTGGGESARILAGSYLTIVR